MIVQIAKARGAYVIATASDRNLEYLKEIGADEVIDYRATRFEDAVRNVDAVVDTVGGETLVRSEQVLRDGGRLAGSTPSRRSSRPASSGSISIRRICWTPLRRRRSTTAADELAAR
jgi:NADPH:quinone reductase-like Zn-dependent oxidoreductase